MQDSTLNERRRFARYTIDIPIRIAKKNNGQPYYGRGNNVSEGGLQALIAAELTVGDEIEISLSLPYYSSQELSIPCVIRNRDGYRYGVEFIPSKPEHRDVVTKVCSILALVYDKH